MGTFLQLALSAFLLPLLWWSAVFVLAAACVGACVIYWLIRRIRAMSSWGLRVSRVRVLLAGLTVCAASVLFPFSIAFLHAVPYSIERSLASSIERSAPLASDWLVDFSAEQMASLLQVDVDAAAIDISQMSARVSTALATLKAGGRPEPLLDRLKWLSMTESLGPVERAVAELRGQVSWHDLVLRTKSLMRTRLSWLSKDVKLSLEAAAMANVYSAAAQVSASNLVSVLIVLLVVRGQVKTPLGTTTDVAILNSGGQGQPERGTPEPNPRPANHAMEPTSASHFLRALRNERAAAHRAR